MGRFVLALALIALVTSDFVVAQDDLLNSGSKAFSAKFFADVIKNRPNTSLIMSSYSVVEPLSQLAVGAQGSTAAELYSALGIPGMKALKIFFPAERKRVSSAHGVELRFASRIFVNSRYELSSYYNIEMQKIFNAEIKSIDVSDPLTTANTINAWVESKTNHRIKDIVKPDSIDSLTRLLLVNAAYFKGNWTQKFNIQDTKNQKFYGPKKTKNVTMMHQTAYLMFREDAATGSKFLELPYEGGDASLRIVLPGKNVRLEEFTHNLQSLEKEFEAMALTTVAVALPKFSIQTEIDLAKVLPRIGVKEIFDSTANLTKILSREQQLYVTDAKQKASFDVNENGSEASVANVVELAFLLPMPIEPTATFVADHPFAFFLRIRNTTVFEGVFAS